jgi:UDP-N-acetyl-D-galactosamine dehydrogenase
MLKHDLKVKNAKILMLGITFKENCPDVRNTKVVDVVKHLKDYGTNVTIYDPWANPEEVQHEYNIKCHAELDSASHKAYDAIVLTVAHKQFVELNLDDYKSNNAVVYDVKGILGEKADNKL